MAPELRRQLRGDDPLLSADSLWTRSDRKRHVCRVVGDGEMLAAIDAKTIDRGKLAGAGAGRQDGEGVANRGNESVNQRHIESSIQTRPIGHGQLAILRARG